MFTFVINIITVQLINKIPIFNITNVSSTGFWVCIPGTIRVFASNHGRGAENSDGIHRTYDPQIGPVLSAICSIYEYCRRTYLSDRK